MNTYTRSEKMYHTHTHKYSIATYRFHISHGGSWRPKSDHRTASVFLDILHTHVQTFTCVCVNILCSQILVYVRLSTTMRRTNIAEILQTGFMTQNIGALLSTYTREADKGVFRLTAGTVVAIRTAIRTAIAVDKRGGSIVGRRKSLVCCFWEGDRVRGNVGIWWALRTHRLSGSRYT